MTHLANLKRARLSDDPSSTSNVPPSPRQQRTAINSEVGGPGVDLQRLWYMHGLRLRCCAS